MGATMGPSVTDSAAWQALVQHRQESDALRLVDIVTKDGQRLDHCEIDLEGLHFNYALNNVTPKTIELLIALAQQQKLEDWRDRMFRGDKINVTENRAVLHTALRQKNDQPLMVDGHDIIQDIKVTRTRIETFVSSVRDGQWKGASGKPIRHIVNIGIGGSDLGPRLAAKALSGFASGPAVHFVANVDAYDLLSVLEKIDPAETLFVIVSKTFTTQETLMNAQTARSWLVGKMGEAAVAQHFVAVSVNQTEVQKFGIDQSHMFPMWDWVGGRYSVWSAVGISVALAVGNDNFKKMCDGAAAMDTHFRTAPLMQNMPAMLGLMGIWNRNFMNRQVLAILPYSERLRDLPRFLQQLDMESNGKSVTREGAPVGCGTSPVLFGECGSVGQHSFHQWLHQGTDIVPVDFIGVIQDDLNQPAHHRALTANMMAQATAFAFGQSEAASSHDVYPGNRPSNVIMLDRLDPYRFGMLLALYEHKIFVQGVVWNINSFDQPGVELGKRMAKTLDSDKPAQGVAQTFLAGLFGRFASVSEK